MKRFCSNCGTKLNDNDSFCGSCGTNIKNNNINSDTYYKDKTYTNKSNVGTYTFIGTILGIIIGIFLLNHIGWGAILGGSVGYLIYKIKNKEKIKFDKEKFIKLVKIIIPISAAIILIGVITFYLYKNTILFKDNPGVLIVYLPFTLCFISYIVMYFYLKTNSKRTIIKIEVVSNDYDLVDKKIKQLLKELCYKEKKYKKEKVYYAHKQRVVSELLRVHSYKRYISYTINNGILEIQSWIPLCGGEIAIDNTLWLAPTKNILIIELNMIGSLLNVEENE